VDEHRSEAHEAAPHEQRSQDAPEQDSVLVLRRDAQVTEDGDEDEQVVDAERPLDEVAGEELEGGPAPDAQVHTQRKEHRKGEPTMLQVAASRKRRLGFF
jgi:hypothetical protein